MRKTRETFGFLHKKEQKKNRHILPVYGNKKHMYSLLSLILFTHEKGRNPPAGKTVLFVKAQLIFGSIAEAFDIPAVPKESQNR